MGILLALVAGMLIPLTNLTTRKSIDIGGSTKGYFMIQMATSFLFSLFLGPIRAGEWTLSLPVVLLGVVAGAVLSVMLFTLGKAVEKGPPGLTFAILNGATVMPGLLMALIFGAAFGFTYHFWHGFGSFLVLAGLFWGAKGLQNLKEMKTWLLFSTSMLLLHILLLSLFQWKGMLTQHPEAGSPFFTLDQIQSQWFAPCMFFTSGLVQLAVFLSSNKVGIRKGEIFYGVSGGVTNLFCTLALLRATEVAGPLEQAIIFPIYSVVGIILTNIWGQRLYQEEVNWRACQLCAFGLIVGTVDWKAIAAAIGF